MLISNYGLFWQRKYVNFNYGGNEGTLLGKINKKKLFLVDFREQAGIYVLYDKDFIPIYVGQAGNGNETLFTRLQYHTTDYLSNSWEYFTWFGFRRVNANGSLAPYGSMGKTSRAKGGRSLDDSEGLLMTTKGPKIKGPAEEYRQVEDEDGLEMSMEDVVAGIEELKKQKKTIEKRLKLNKKSK